MSDTQLLLPQPQDSRSEPFTDEVSDFLEFDPDPWVNARRFFPRIPAPWDVFPPGLSDSMRQLARSCTTSSDALFGSIFPIIGSIFGRYLNICAKESWVEPLVFFYADVRPSGSGKSVTERLLLSPLKVIEKNLPELLKKAATTEKVEAVPGSWPLIFTDFTHEGLRDLLSGHPTGGLLCNADELSILFNHQRRGNRENLLTLWDGVDKTFYLATKTIKFENPRVSFTGGIQPSVLDRVVKKKILRDDGTLARFLFFTEGRTYHEDIGQEWTAENKLAWESLLLTSTMWVCVERTKLIASIPSYSMLKLNSEGQAKFVEWINKLVGVSLRVPSELAPFIAKAKSYALRLTAIIHVVEAICCKQSFESQIGANGVTKGITAMEFFLGQTVSLLQAGNGRSSGPSEHSERTLALAHTLDQLRDQVDKGLLAIGIVKDEFERRNPETKMSAKGMGIFLSSLGFNKTPKKADMCGLRQVFGLHFDEKVERFIRVQLNR